MIRVSRVVVVIFAASVAACHGGDSKDVRGRGLSIATVSAESQAQIYEAAARAAFETGDPSLSLLLDRRVLPRTIGLEVAGRIAEPVAAEMRRRGIVRGACEPSIVVRTTPLCTAELPGYVLRFSPVFTVPGDSVEVYVFAQKYDTRSSGHSPPLRFERAYEVVKTPSGGWRAAREGRISKEIRGERDK